MSLIARLGCVVVLSVLASIPFAGAPVGVARGGAPFVVRVAATPAEAAGLEQAGFDLVEARDGPDVFAVVDGDEWSRLLAAGWDARVAPASDGRAARPMDVFPSGYRSVGEIERQLQAWNSDYPALVELVDYGDSWERVQDATAGHDLWALRLTDETQTTRKPGFFLLAAIHARELATTEVALRWAAELLAGYGGDTSITRLLQTREIWIVPLANPDGRVRAETGVLWRKNTNAGPATCLEEFYSHAGVDLNRNSSWLWGTINAPWPATDYCAQTYPGVWAASEPEVAALETLVSDLFPPRVDETDAAGCASRRQDTPGLFITLHSYGDLVLYPWGHTDEPACQAASLQTLATRFAAFNGYQAYQAVGLYPTSGTTDDWAYGALGLASFTFEIGPIDGVCAGFFPPVSCVEEFYQENRGALSYAAAVASDPYSLDYIPRVYMPFVR